MVFLPTHSGVKKMLDSENGTAYIVSEQSLTNEQKRERLDLQGDPAGRPYGGNSDYYSSYALDKMRPKDHTKELIARTALRLFVEKGIDGATIRDIAAAAGIAEGTLYRHYPGKDALAWDLFSRNYTAFALELRRIEAGQATLRAKLAAMVRQFCTFFDDDPVLFSYLLLAQHGQLQKVTPDMPNPVEVVREVWPGAWTGARFRRRL